MTLRMVMTNAIVLRIIQGLSLGLYLYIYPMTLLDAFGGYDPDPAHESSALFLVAVVFAFGIMLEAMLELPLGAYGDIRGYKPTLALSFLFRTIYFIGFIPLIFFKGEVTFASLIAFATIALFSISYTCWSGTNSAWFYESVKSVGAEEKYEKLLSKVLIFYYSAFIAGSIISAWVYFEFKQQIGDKYIFDKGEYIIYSLGAIICLLGTIYSRFIISEPRKFEPRAYITELGVVLSEAYKYCLKVKNIFLLIQLSAFFTLLIYVTDYLWPIYAKDILNIKSFNIKWLSIVVVMTFSNLLGNIIIVRIPARPNENESASQWRRLLLACMAYGLPIAILSLLAIFIGDGRDGFLLFLFLVAIGKIAEGGKEAPFDALLNRSISHAKIENAKRSPEETRATILSAATIFNALVVLLFFVPTTVLTTVLGQKNTVQGWIIPSALLMIFVLLTRKRLK